MVLFDLQVYQFCSSSIIPEISHAWDAKVAGQAVKVEEYPLSVGNRNPGSTYIWTIVNK
jgi:hypothetical protein